ncbi:GreA/GreB family elongation factor [Paenibacillus polysaccharolyticus]|uniref:Transcription elongation factor GreA n=2 Tax=Paenibacillus TaxID=44249 RepID=A0A1G5BAP2_9BACL|nr:MULTISPECIES: GreA/GreB family elongation factor [Paenibacillus]MDP9699163.1 transcription elongation factor GreA [Paenibacillus intestini]MBY0205871.1 GreA/GreB family elongation factor [Paenibacillus cucumis (ex Kampfer et al. 2016)]MCM3133423.1 GreA/GreB family elongation factor [Paenibacillus polysaccharolyticus]MCP1132431.1 GreA/GreB family elongation factor [Paenibacillus polysaccharolyticus]SCX87222.1 transcription elongation factor GreA [Paenibacillus polysaccharolyticus]
MNRRTPLDNCREMLVSQLLTLGEEKRTFLDAYFDVRNPERILLDKQLTAYTDRVERLLAGPDELLSSVVLIGSQIELEYVDFHTSDKLTIVMPEEADPDEGQISFLSPVGRQLLLGNKGEMRAISTPSGDMKIRIADIQWAFEQSSELVQELEQADEAKPNPLQGLTQGGANHAL